MLLSPEGFRPQHEARRYLQKGFQSVLADRLKGHDIQTFNAEELPNKPLQVMLYNHKTHLDTAAIAHILRAYKPEQILFNMVRPVSGTARRLLQYTNLLNTQIHTRSDTSDPEERERLNRHLFQNLAQTMQRLRPATLSIAPDAGSSETRVVEHEKVQTRGLQMLIDAFQSLGIGSENVGIIPVNLNIDSTTALIHVGQDISSNVFDYRNRMKSLSAAEIKPTNSEFKGFIADAINNSLVLSARERT